MKEIKRKLSGKIAEFEVKPIIRQEDVTVVEYRVEREYREPRSGMYIPVGTMSYGFFWKDRPFNCYYFWEKGSPLVAYFNLSSRLTQLSADEIDWLDLEVDIIVFPDGSIHVIDEEEVPSDLDADYRRDLEQGVEWIRRGQARPLLDEMNGLLEGFDSGNAMVY